jgi:hypothetical protein
MSNPTNWPIVTDGENYLRHNEKRLLHEQRRPIVGHGNIVGPGISRHANQIDDFNDDVAATNGFYWAWNGTPNCPPGIAGEDEESYVWLVNVISRSDDDPQGPLSGTQYARSNLRFSEEVNEFGLEVCRTWIFDPDAGVRVYGPWQVGRMPSVGMSVDETVTATTTATWYGGAPVDSPFDVPQPSNFIYVPSTETLAFVTVTISLQWTNDTAGVFRRVIFWPTFDGSLASPHAASGEVGQWSHHGQGTVGFVEVYTVTRSWWLFPPTEGFLSTGVVIRAPEGNVALTSINSYWQLVR